MQTVLHSLFLILLTCPPVLYYEDGNLGLFSSKNTYENIKYHPKFKGLSWTKENIPNCLTPVHLDAVLRHGTRFPSKKNIDLWNEIVPKFQQLIASSNSSLISASLKEAIGTWKNEFQTKHSNKLTAHGWREHIRLAHSYYHMMPSLFKKHDGETSFNVSSSRKSRSRKSAEAFVTAVQFAVRHDVIDEKHPDLTFTETLREPESIGNVTVHVDDENMRYFDNCGKFQERVKTNVTAFAEYDKYFRTAKFAEVLSHLSVNKKLEGAYEIYLLCAFETAVFGKSVWCKLFSEKDFRILEYAGDLKHHYQTGSAYPINYEQSCVLLKTILNNIERGRSIALRFGHAETLIPLLRLIGFYGDDLPMNSSNFDLHGNRSFFTGLISPFAGNLAIVLYNSDHSKYYPSSLYISFIVNENIMKVPGFDCYFCDFSKGSRLQKLLEEKVENCSGVCRLLQGDEL